MCTAWWRSSLPGRAPPSRFDPSAVWPRCGVAALRGGCDGSPRRHGWHWSEMAALKHRTARLAVLWAWAHHRYVSVVRQLPKCVYHALCAETLGISEHRTCRAELSHACSMISLAAFGMHEVVITLCARRACFSTRHPQSGAHIRTQRGGGWSLSGRWWFAMRCMVSSVACCCGLVIPIVLR